MKRRLALAAATAPAVIAQCDANGQLTTAPTNRFSHTSAAAYAPAGTVSAAPVMMGLAAGANPWLLTPNSSGNVRVRMTGAMFATAVANVFGTVRYGTGAPPANGAAQTGTSAQAQPTQVYTPAANTLVPFAFEAEITGLTPGVATWFDWAMGTSAGTGSLFINGVIIEEMP